MALAVVSDTLEIAFCFYAVAHFVCRQSDFFRRISKQPTISAALTILLGAVSMVLFLLTTLLLLPFALYKKTVDTFLKLKHKRDYNGLLKGIDAMWAAEHDEAKHIINLLYFIRSDKPADQLVEHCQQKFLRVGNFQFKNLIKRCMGYCYRLNFEAPISEFIRLEPISETERSYKFEFEEKISRLSSRPLPRDNTAPFEVLFFAKPVTFYGLESDGGKRAFALLARIHHSVGDGISLSKFMLKVLADEKVPLRSKMLEVKDDSRTDLFNGKRMGKLKIDLSGYRTRIGEALKSIAGAEIYHFGPVASQEINIWHGGKLSGEKVLAYSAEETPRLVSKIKAIKKRVPDVAFTDVVFTAMSASFFDYFKKNADSIPESLYIVFIVAPSQKNAATNEDQVDLNYKFSMGTVRLPLNLGGDVSNLDLILRFRRVKEECERFRRSLDILVIHWQLRILSDLLPLPLIKSLFRLNEACLSFSNLPGVDAIRFCGQEVVEQVFWVPNVGNTGVGFSLLTYDGRFQMGVAADKVFISDSEKAHAILEDVFENIDSLHKIICIDKVDV